MNMRWVAIFPGQGSQFLGMGQDLPESYRREFFEIADRVTGHAISSMIHGPKHYLMKTFIAQPAVVALSCALYKGLRDTGWPTPLAYAGHSLGEYSALYAGRMWDFKNTMKILQIRSQAMYTAGLNSDGAMAAVVKLSLSRVSQLLQDIPHCYIANHNHDSQIVVSGKRSALIELEERIKRCYGKMIFLDVDGAFHSPLMEEAALAVKQVLDTTPQIQLDAPLITNASANSQNDPQVILEHLVRNMTYMVRWSETMHHIIKINPDVVIDIGPGSVLANLMKRTNFEREIVSVSQWSDVEKCRRILRS